MDHDNEHHDNERRVIEAQALDEALDQALELTFPASDPIALTAEAA
jgi:hypothetical protein